MKLPRIHSLASYPAEHMTVQALADHLGVDERTIVRMIERGELRAVRVGRQWRIVSASARAVFAGDVSRETASGGASSIDGLTA